MRIKKTKLAYREGGLRKAEVFQTMVSGYGRILGRRLFSGDSPGNKRDPKGKEKRFFGMERDPQGSRVSSQRRYLFTETRGNCGADEMRKGESPYLPSNDFLCTGS